MVDGGLVTWTSVFELNRVPDDSLSSARVGETPVVVARVDGDVFAFVDVCPHRSAPLSDGDIDDGQLICASHGWVFDVRSGESVEPRGHRLTALPCRVAEGTIQVGRASG